MCELYKTRASALLGRPLRLMVSYLMNSPFVCDYKVRQDIGYCKLSNTIAGEVD